MSHDTHPLGDAILLVIDIQNDYFPGGAMALVQPEAAAAQAALALDRFRQAGRPVIHIRHEAARPGATFFLPGTPGAEIQAAVAPRPGETVVTKAWPNSFRDTALGEAVAASGASRLVVAGMMTHMCVDATVRAGFDLGYAVTVLADACATRDLSFDGRQVPAADVQAAFLAALAAVYAAVVPTAALAAAAR
ncbi:cysteine hydrolase family protein [Desulfovibrio sp. TomC]|uniref:cysteine hydrolase family protein n=1 Tax=Desulfovibrio sp. TomC TaxID=1562888 RepID=UPI0005740EEA|nr:cysteine hydrolase family protein [Desulfovibrio sp. TomC]KHK02959.1 Isochorismatase [Desulfovibrio sp. TomC]